MRLDELIKTVRIELIQQHLAQQLRPFAPMYADSLQVSILQELQYAESIIFHTIMKSLKGDITKDTVMHEVEFNFKIFKSWEDHLKYRLNRRWSWLKFKVNYIISVQRQKFEIPVTIHRSCPHAILDFNTHMLKHVEFLLPVSYKINQDQV